MIKNIFYFLCRVFGLNVYKYKKRGLDTSLQTAIMAQDGKFAELAKQQMLDSDGSVV